MAECDPAGDIAKLGEEVGESREKKLVTAGSHWKVESAFLTGMAGEGGGEVLRGKVWSCLPTADREIAIEESLQQLSALTSSTLWQFTSEQQQHSLQAGVDLVKNMGQGVSPGVIKDGDAFVGTVLHRLSSSADGRVKILPRERLLN